MRWGRIVVWAGWIWLAITVLVTIAVLVAPRGWLRTTVNDDWTHQDLAKHLKAKGVEVEVQQVTEMSAIFRDPTGGRVAVIRGDEQSARELHRQKAASWGDSFTVGPFFIAATDHPADVSLCRRMRRALE